ncbi:macrophage mannose receptor 1-like isoform 2-T3 [Cyanocitta cristata]
MYGNVETALDKAWGAGEVSELEAALEAEKAKERPPPAAPTPSGSFLLYNEHHSACVAASGRTLGLARCSPSSPAQRFQWLPRGRLRSRATGLCVTATASAERALVRLAACREDWRLQRWACGPGALLELEGTALHFNFGHSAEGEVMLFAGKGEWSRWLVHGTRDAVCSRACFPPCSKGWLFFRNSCYFFSQAAASWEDSRFFCSALGSQLLEVDDAEEKIHVQSQLRGPSWLGIRDQEREGTWSRGDGTALGNNGSWWHRDEPNGGTLENCAAVRQDGLWADYPCGTRLAWVCEGPP